MSAAQIFIIFFIIIGAVIVALTFPPDVEDRMSRLDDDWELDKSRSKKLK